MSEGATVARLGGDEFGVLLPEVPTEADALAAAAEVREIVGRPYEIGEMTLESGGSIGVACWPEHADRRRPRC